MRWSDVFTEFECKHNHLLEKLELNKTRMMEEIKKHNTAAEIVSDAAMSTAAENATWENSAEPIGLVAASNPQ